MRTRKNFALRPLTTALLIWTSVVAAGAGAVGLYLGAVAREERRRIEAEATTAAKGLEQTALRSFGAALAVQDLLRLRHDLLAQHELIAVSAVERYLAWTVRQGRFGLVGAGVTDLGGVLSFTTAEGMFGLSVADREPVRRALAVAAGDPATALPHIGSPAQGAATGRWSIPITDLIRRPTGETAAVSIVALDPVALGDSMAQVVPGRGRMAAIRRTEDGTLLVRSRDPLENLARGPARDHPVLLAARQAPDGILEYASRADGRPVIAAYRVVPGLPLAVSAVFDADVEWAGYRDLTRAVVLGAVAAAGLLLILAVAWAGRRKQAARAAMLERERIELNLRLARERAEARERLAHERAELAERLATQRREILATMSHEIRTPLTALLGFSELLAEAELPPTQAEQARTVAESGRLLLALVNDLLDLARLEAGKVSLEQVPYRPAEVFRDGARLARMLAAAKPVRILLDLAPDLPDWAEGDPTRLRQVVGNLLSNAVKFTAAGSVTLAARVAPAGPGAAAPLRLTVEVRDSGIGIAPDALARLFTMFEQAGADTARRFGGTGLGLAICRRLVEAQGGSIGAESEPGRGSTFRFSIPLRPAAAPADAEPAHSTPAEAGRRRSLRVLVADDMQTNRLLMQAFLVSAGHRPLLAANGVEAVAAAQAECFDAILLDVNMPLLDGLDAARRIRAGGGPSADAPILALTAETGLGEREAILEAGMDAHLCKPIGRDALLAVLDGVADAPRPAILAIAAQ